MVSAAQAKKLADELSALSRQQAETIQNAVYIAMTKVEGRHYDERAKRIKEICTLLGTYQPLWPVERREQRKEYRLEANPKPE